MEVIVKVYSGSMDDICNSLQIHLTLITISIGLLFPTLESSRRAHTIGAFEYIYLYYMYLYI